MMVDLSRQTKISSGARKQMAEISRPFHVNKFAFIGASVFIRTVANFIMVAAGQKNAKHFATEEEALKWLKES